MNFRSVAIFVYFFLGGFFMSSQEKTYYDEFWNVTGSIDKAEFYRILEKGTTDTNEVVERSFYLNDKLKSEVFYSNYSNRVRNGSYKSYYANGMLKEQAYYSQGNLTDSLITFWDNGRRKREDFFINGKFQSGKVYNSDGAETLHYDYEIMPEFEGGINELVRYISTHLKYPKVARKKGIQGKVFLRFMVDKEGLVKNVKVLKGVSEEIDAEAIRVVKEMPKWKPGLLDGNKVNTYFNLPLSFKLD